ncbi:MAG: DUF1501 domain-containing protein [Pirellulaceae bacterium]|jgi:hypothetical protein|nr:DUF1501 domain-containing protein [Pirellulaceae bacterium]MDP7014672.1 DUF1501 domain-containing protein [Pirellulaceae bacterium]
MNIAPLDRRQFAQHLGGGLGALGLAQALQSSLGGAERERTHHEPRAKRVIHLFMNGGPFGGDFFDPKPAIAKFAGQRPKEVDLRTERKTAGLLPSPFKYSPRGVSGVPVSELLPKFASHVDDVCVLRSVYTDNPNHGPALLLMNNGTVLPTRPSMGSWISYGLGSDNENLPTYVVLCPGRPVRFSILWTSAFLPGEFQGTYINHSQLDPQKLIPYVRNARLNEQQQRIQLALMRKLNRGHADRRPHDEAIDSRIRAMETAFKMQFAATEAFDLDREPAHVRAAYGSGHFANGCLLARRLVERGVRYTQVYYGNGQPWDTHQNHHNAVRKLAADIDGPMSALLNDLKQRGMLEDTLVIWGGEFGRTPTSENGNGRDHNHYGFSMWMAGGGVRGGMAYGETDDFGFRAAVDKVHVHDLHATILHLMGVDHERLIYRYAGRDFRLTDVHGRVIKPVVA